MRMVDLITTKRNGGALSGVEIKYIIDGYVTGSIPDYQMSAWMMAVLFKGMTEEETADLTMAMTRSGDMVDLSSIPGIKVDKHSTGGVGDTTTLIVAPLVAACGGTVAKMSGRGLAHSGGTLDKLESIPGVNINRSIEDFIRIVRKTGVCVVGQTGDLAPADKLMYALRDVTGTVESIPLIASSIMSKKIAAGADAVVLDVKMGGGAFMHTLEEARKLARAMVRIGERVGLKTVAVITDMNQPLGMAVGNGLEVKEAVEALSGGVPEGDPLYEVSMLLAENMLVLAGAAEDVTQARKKLKGALESGEGLEKLIQMVTALGGDPMHLKDPQRLVQVRFKEPLLARSGGYVTSVNAEKIGLAAQVLGAGREKKTDIIDPNVGVVMNKRLGDSVSAGESLAMLYANDDQRLREAEKILGGAVNVGPSQPQSAPIVYDVIR